MIFRRGNRVVGTVPLPMALDAVDDLLLRWEERTNKPLFRAQVAPGNAWGHISLDLLLKENLHRTRDNGSR